MLDFWGTLPSQFNLLGPLVLSRCYTSSQLRNLEAGPRPIKAKVDGLFKGLPKRLYKDYHSRRELATISATAFQFMQSSWSMPYIRRPRRVTTRPTGRYIFLPSICDSLSVDNSPVRRHIKMMMTLVTSAETSWSFYD